MSTQWLLTEYYSIWTDVHLLVSLGCFDVYFIVNGHFEKRSCGRNFILISNRWFKIWMFFFNRSWNNGKLFSGYCTPLSVLYLHNDIKYSGSTNLFKNWEKYQLNLNIPIIDKTNQNLIGINRTDPF